jgi:two-component system response regulator GlrR
MVTQRRATADAAPPDPAPGFLAVAPATLRVAEALQRAAATDVRVTLYGESGVGKSHAAACLHALSRRRRAAFSTVSVRDVRAVARLADERFLSSLAGGTLVLSGVDEIPPQLQAVLIGVIEEWCGGGERGEAPIRLVCTGQQALFPLMESGRIRPDLHYLLDVFPLAIPPLRERTEEIPLFVDHFSRRHREAGGKTPAVPQGFLKAANFYPWPGNLRELESVVLAALPNRPNSGWRFPRTLPLRGGEPKLLTFSQAKREFEQSYVRRLLAITGGNVSRAAGLAGKARKDFYALMARNHIDPMRFRPGTEK